MKKILSVLLLPLCVVIAVWVGVILWWNAAHRMPGAADMVIWLVLFPLGLLLGYWLLKKFFDWVKRALAGAAAASSSVSAHANAADATASTAAQSRQFTLQLLGNVVLLPSAQDGKALLALFDEPDLATGTDATLQDADGNPLIVSAVQDIDEQAQRDELQALAGREDESVLTRRMIRTQAMLSQVLERSVAQLEPWLSGTIELRVICAVSAEWTDAQRALLSVWLRQKVQGFGWSTQRLSVQVAPVQTEAEVLLLLDRNNERLNHSALLQAAARSPAQPPAQPTKTPTEPVEQPPEQLGLLLAADSWLDPVQVQKRLSGLFTTQNKKGVIAGEGAAAVWFVRRDLVLSPPPEAESLVLMHRVVMGKRDKSADADGTISADLLGELTRQALQVAQLEVPAVSLAITDVDHRAKRLGEVLRLMSGLAVTDKEPVVVRSVGSSMGHAGVAGALAALVAAQHWVAREQKPALLVSALGEFDRAVTVIRPAPVPSA